MRAAWLRLWVKLRALSRIARVLAHLGRGYWVIRTQFGQLEVGARHAQVQRWSAEFLGLLGVKVVIQGVAKPLGVRGLLLVSNHISWLDITVLHAARDVRFVSKSEVATWPILGVLASGAGTLYIERERKRDALRMVRAMTEALGHGECVGVFPEGTTSDGRALLPFHANLLQAALTADVPALPVAIAFVDPLTNALSQAASFIGDDTLLNSVWRLLASDGIEARVHFLPPDSAHGRDRRDWSLALHAQIAAQHSRLIGTASGQISHPTQTGP